MIKSRLILVGTLCLLFLGGVVAFVVGITGTLPLRAWGVFLVNFLFWSGIAQAGVIFAAILHVTDARWGRPLKRIAEGTAAFLPLSFLCFVGIFFGRNYLLPWIQEPTPEKQAWLNVPFLFARDGISLIILYGLSWLFLYYSLRPDVGAAQRNGEGKPGNLWIMTHGWRSIDEERRRSQRILGILSPLLIILYAVIFSLIAFDLVMSLDPHWYSTLFGGYFFIGNLYLGLASLAIIATFLRGPLQLDIYITPDQFHDLGKLIFAFSMLWAYLFFSQYLVIWYGNLPEETGFIILRTKGPPWAPLSWIVLITCFLLPFVILLSREVKRNPKSLSLVSAVIVVGMWLERYVLVVPSLWHGSTIPLGWTELLITSGFFAAFALSFLLFTRTFPMLPLTDPFLQPPSPSHAATSGGSHSYHSEKATEAPQEGRPEMHSEKS